MVSLNEKLLAAHAAGDGWAMVELYAAAADQANSVDERCYFNTNAYIFAIELNHPLANTLFQRLRDHNRI